MLILPVCLLVSTGAEAGWSDLWLTAGQQGQHLLNAWHPEQAAKIFKDPRRQAYADLRAGRYAEAASLLQPFKDVDSEYNRGNALARAGQLQAALEAYDNALKLDPDNRDTRHNRDLVAKALKNKQKDKQKDAKPQGQKHGAQQPKGKNGSKSGSSPQQGGAASGQPGKGKDQAKGADSAAAGAGKQAADDKQQAQRDAAAAAALQQARAKADKDKGAKGERSKEPQSAGTGTADKPSSGKRSDGERSAARTGNSDDDTDAEHDTKKPSPKPKTEQALALDQWLRQIPDDPGGLLRRKFLIEHAMRQRQSIEL
ncbi:MAG TPA: tetratricopeptide repeat protein [Gammaproteobacteria bacterium]|nr:tetratricopeptide repeat protein [Gammaproteobacteria bacterium]